MDLSKLSDEQLQIALKVADEAKRQGLNPDFVLPMVMVESAFNPNAVSRTGAIGVMQLMPQTAKSLDVDPTNLDQNISGGITFIKQLMSNKNIGNDPQKVLMGYNAGPNTKFFQTGNLQDLPDETLNHILQVANAYGGTLPSVVESGQAAVVPKAPTEGKPLVEPGQKSVAPTEIPVPVAGAAGAILGAGAGATGAVTKAKIDAAKEAYETIKNKINPPAAPEPTMTSGEKWAAKTGYGMGEGTTQEVSSRYQRNVPSGKVSGRMAKRYGVPLPGESRDLTQRLIDRANAAEAAKAAEAARAAEAMAASKSSPMWSYARKLLSMPLKGAFFGAGAGMGAADAYNRYNAGDKSGAAISGVGTLASMAAPFVGSAGALPAAAVAAPLYLMASDRLKHLQEHPEDYRLEESNFDPLGMPIRGPQ